jgi:hypothetical protein
MSFIFWERDESFEGKSLIALIPTRTNLEEYKSENENIKM